MSDHSLNSDFHSWDLNFSASSDASYPSREPSPAIPALLILLSAVMPSCQRGRATYKMLIPLGACFETSSTILAIPALLDTSPATLVSAIDQAEPRTTSGRRCRAAKPVLTG